MLIESWNDLSGNNLRVVAFSGLFDAGPHAAHALNYVGMGGRPPPTQELWSKLQLIGSKVSLHFAIVAGSLAVFPSFEYCTHELLLRRDHKLVGISYSLGCGIGKKFGLSRGD